MLNFDNVLVITGKSGSGKSRFLRKLEALADGRLLVVDPLVKQPAKFEPPQQAPQMFAIDHADFVDDAATYCNDAVRWAKSAGVTLSLVAFRVDDLTRLGIELPVGLVEMRLCDGGDGMTMSFKGEERRFTAEEFAKGLATAAAAGA